MILKKYLGDIEGSMGGDRKYLLPASTQHEKGEDVSMEIVQRELYNKNLLIELTGGKINLYDCIAVII